MEAPIMNERADPSYMTKILAVEFYKALTRSLVEAVRKEKDRYAYESSLKNFWVLLWSFWGAIRNSSGIHKEEWENINDLLSKPPKDIYDAQAMLYAVFDIAAKVGIFVDFRLYTMDYDPL